MSTPVITRPPGTLTDAGLGTLIRGRWPSTTRGHGEAVVYRLFRNPLLMFVLVGPVWALILEPRVVPRKARPRVRRSHVLTDVALAVIVGALCWLAGWREFLLVQTPTVLMAGGTGIWLFYVTHQFENAYWEHTQEWDFVDAALRGSSHLELPRILQVFTANVGLHHIHHLSARIPNYNLQRAHNENVFLHRAPRLSLWDGLQTVRLKLYDERSQRLVTFSAARQHGDA